MAIETFLNLGIFAFVIVFLWLFILSFFVFNAVRHYQKLTSGIKKEDLKSILNELLERLKIDGKRIDEVLKKAENLEEDGVFHVQKIGLVRFNPFEETGGDQSFTLALLDGDNHGVVISSLYRREGTRIYAKPVEKGKGTKYELSFEEKEAIKKAVKKQKFEILKI